MLHNKIYSELLRYRVILFMIFIVCGLIFSCADNKKPLPNIDHIIVDLDVARFDREFAKADAKDLPDLKAKFPYLFPTQYPDSIWVTKLSDPLQNEILLETDKAFPNFKAEASQLELLFRYAKYYFPKIKAPKVVTVISDVDYANRIILTDSLLLIGLDNYLGATHRFYEAFPKYVAAGLDKQFLVSDVAAALATKVVPKPKDRSFLAQMLYYGKLLYVKDAITPFLSDAQKINYSQAQIAWAKENEEQIWRNFIEQEHLYSTDSKIGQRFLDPAPFSKFGLELDNDSPGRVGRFVGWQIVRSFMSANESKN